MCAIYILVNETGMIVGVFTSEEEMREAAAKYYTKNPSGKESMTYYETWLDNCMKPMRAMRGICHANNEYVHAS